MNGLRGLFNRWCMECDSLLLHAQKPKHRDDLMYRLRSRDSHPVTVLARSVLAQGENAYCMYLQIVGLQSKDAEDFGVDLNHVLWAAIGEFGWNMGLQMLTHGGWRITTGWHSYVDEDGNTVYTFVARCSGPMKICESCSLPVHPQEKQSKSKGTRWMHGLARRIWK